MKCTSHDPSSVISLWYRSRSVEGHCCWRKAFAQRWQSRARTRNRSSSTTHSCTFRTLGAAVLVVFCRLFIRFPGFLDVLRGAPGGASPRQVHQGRPKHARRWDPSNLGDRAILGEVSLCCRRRLRGAEVMKKLLALEPHVLRRVIGWLPLYAFKAAWLVLATVANASQRSRNPGSKKQSRETWSRLGRPACLSVLRPGFLLLSC